jgi:hypothetical protein
LCYNGSAMSRQLKDWALLGSASDSAVVLRVFTRNGALAGAFTVTPGTSPVYIKDAVWNSTGWSDDFVAAEVVTAVASGHVYAAPVKDVTVLTSATGETLCEGFNLGPVPLDKGADEQPTF